MAKATPPEKLEDLTAEERAHRERHALDQAVAAAQRSVAEAPAAETQAARDARIARDRKATEERNAAVAEAQAAELRPAKVETQADRDARIEHDRREVIERQEAVIEAIHAENVARAEALGLPEPTV